jgi:hypothetical protein
MPAGYVTAWMPFGEALEHVERVAGCSRATACRDLYAVLRDGGIAARFTDGNEPIPPAEWPDGAHGALVLVEGIGPLFSNKDGSVRRVELCREDVERLWPMRDRADDAVIEVAAVDPKAMAAPRRRRSPAPGSLNRYAEADRALHREIRQMMREDHLSATAAAQKLAEAGRVVGTGSTDSRARRLATRYLREKRKGKTR